MSLAISYVVPVFNGEKYISDCIASIESQLSDEDEIVIVDDGSTDSTKQECLRFCKGNNRIRILSGVNEGTYLARARGISSSCGDYVVCIDGDDALRPDFSLLVKKIIEDCGPDVITFQLSRDMQDWDPMPDELSIDAGLKIGDDFCLVRKALFCGWGMMRHVFKRGLFESDLVNKNDYTSFLHHEDMALLIPIFDKASSLYYLKEPLYYYRPNDTSVISTYRTTRLRDISRVSSVLDKYVPRWGSESQALARRYIQLRYVECAFAAASSDLGRTGLKRELERISSELNAVAVKGEAEISRARLDCSLVYKLLCGNKNTALMMMLKTRSKLLMLVRAIR